MTTQQSPLQQFQRTALTAFTRKITDIFFYYIENDKDLLQEYIRVIGRGNDLDTTNKELGKAVKAWFRLNNGNLNKKPKSKLIRSYREHTRP